MALTKLKVGDPITEEWLAELVDAVQQALTVRGSAGMSPTRGLTGVAVRNDPVAQFMLGELQTNLQSKDKDKDFHYFNYDHTASDPWSDSTNDVSLVSDPDQGLRLTGERHLFYASPAAGQWLPIPGMMIQFGKIYAQPGGAGQAYDVEVYKVTSSNTPPAPQTTGTSTYHVYAYQWGNSNLPNGTKVFVWQHRQSKLWVFMAAVAGAWVTYGSVTTKITGLSGGINGTGVVELYDINGNDLGVSVTVTNQLPYPYAVGDFIRLLWDSASGQWYPLDQQIAAPLVGFVTSGTTDISVGSTGSIQIQDDQGNNIFTTSARALTHLARQQKVMVWFDNANNEYFATPLNYPLIVQVTQSGGIAWQATGTAKVKQSDETDPTGGAVTFSGCYAFYRTMAQNEFCLLCWDWYKNTPNGQPYLIPLNVQFLAKNTGASSVAQGATGTVHVYKPNSASGAPVDTTFTLSNVHALTAWTMDDWLLVWWDGYANELVGAPIQRPITGKVDTSNIAAGATGSVLIKDDQLADPADGAASVMARAFIKLVKNQPCVLWWDWFNQEWAAMPAPVLDGAHMVLGGDDLTDVTGYNAANIQALGHDASGVLKWYDSGACP